MTGSAMHETAAALAALAEPMPRERRPPAGDVKTWLRTTPAVRTVVPARLALGHAAARGRRAWDQDAAAREQALRAIEVIVAGTPRADQVEWLARRWLVEQEILDALLWQSQRPFSFAPGSGARLRAALDMGRGALLSFTHHGPYFGIGTTPAQLGHPAYQVSGSWLLHDRQPGTWGRRAARVYELIRRWDGHGLEARGSAKMIAALLRRGAAVSNAFDMPGRHETRFLGKAVMLAGGTVRLALETGALVIPVHAVRSGHRRIAQVAEPLDPFGLDDADALQRAIAATHERWILAQPEALEDPHRTGAWEDGASPEAWCLPTGRARG